MGSLRGMNHHISLRTKVIQDRKKPTPEGDLQLSFTLTGTLLLTRVREMRLWSLYWQNSLLSQQQKGWCQHFLSWKAEVFNEKPVYFCMLSNMLSNLLIWCWNSWTSLEWLCIYLIPVASGAGEQRWTRREMPLEVSLAMCRELSMTAFFALVCRKILNFKRRTVKLGKLLFESLLLLLVEHCIHRGVSVLQCTE